VERDAVRGYGPLGEGRVARLRRRARRGGGGERTVDVPPPLQELSRSRGTVDLLPTSHSQEEFGKTGRCKLPLCEIHRLSLNS
jgi:hypothetical protein